MDRKYKNVKQITSRHQKKKLLPEAQGRGANAKKLSGLFLVTFRDQQHGKLESVC